MILRPILISAPMIPALLDCSKTQARRIVKCTDSGRVKAVGSARNWHLDDPDAVLACPYGVVGDRLWVRETWDFLPSGPQRAMIRYWAGGDNEERDVPEDFDPMLYGKEHQRPSIHMPRWASRLTLEITDVRVQRVQEISEPDARAEGAELLYLRVPTLSAMRRGHAGWMHESERSYRGGFAFIWDTVDAKRGHGWNVNPLVWAIAFREVP